MTTYTVAVTMVEIDNPAEQFLSIVNEEDYLLLKRTEYFEYSDEYYELINRLWDGEITSPSYPIPVDLVALYFVE